LSRARRKNDARDDRIGHGAVVIQPVLDRRPHHRVDDVCDLRVVEAIFRLTLELRFFDEDAEDAGKTFADVFSAQRHTLIAARP